MRFPTGHRRQFFQRSGVAAAAGIVSGALARPRREKQPGSIRLGGPALSSSADPDEQAQAHRRLGYRAAYCPGSISRTRADPRHRRAPSPGTMW